MAQEPSAAPTLLIIRGVTRDGRRFRPSDWSERLRGACLHFMKPPAGAPGRGIYTGISHGIDCLIANRAIEAENPMLYEFLLRFARDNDLVVEYADRFPPDA